MHGRFIAKIFAALQSLPDALQLRNSRVVVSLSGGPDSTALLIAVCEVAAQLGIEVHACHINHKRRGEDSDLDESFCRALCKHLAVELHIFDGNVRSEKKGPSKVSEESLRDVRRAFLNEKCELLNASTVLLAHTSNDQTETVLFRLLRGTSLSGFAGMKPAHQMNNGLWYVRPMLNCTREEVVEFLAEKGVEARFDASNASSDYARNFLRNEIIPLCQTRFPSMTRQVERLREITEAEDELLSCVTDQAAEHFGGITGTRWSVPEFEQLHISIKRRALAKGLALRQIQVSYERLQAILNMMAEANPSSRISLNERWDLSLDKRFLTWIDKDSAEDFVSFESTFVPVNLPGYTFLLASGTILSIENMVESIGGKALSRESLEVFVDLSHIEGQLAVRSVNPLDKIQPLGMKELVSIKKYFHTNNKRIRPLKNLVLADERDILWVPGVGLSERVRVTERSTHRLRIAEIAPDAQLA